MLWKMSLNEPVESAKIMLPLPRVFRSIDPQHPNDFCWLSMWNEYSPPARFLVTFPLILFDPRGVQPGCRGRTSALAPSKSSTMSFHRMANSSPGPVKRGCKTSMIRPRVHFNCSLWIATATAASDPAIAFTGGGWRALPLTRRTPTDNAP
jgi:hypothetical protein